MATPLSNIKLLANVDIKNDYKNSFTFGSASAQASFFSAKAIQTKANLSYVRKDNVIRYDGVADDLYNVSYLMYQNPDFSNKWFYAFVTSIKYISDKVTHITFEIDVIQTWYFELVYRDSYVEREHVADDTIGLHLVDENLNTGEYIIRSTDTFLDLNPLAIVVASTAEPDGGGGYDDVVGDNYAGVYSGAKLFAFDRTTGITALNLFLLDIASAGKADAIVSIFLMPKNLLPPFSDGDAIYAPNALTLDFTYPKNTSDLDGYKPKNNKLFTYPYNFLYVSNHNGGTGVYRYEYSSQSNMQFYAVGDIAPSPTVSLVPKYYKNAVANFDEIMRLSDYPLCSWTTDLFNNWKGQHSISAALGLAGTGVGVAGALGVGGAVAGSGAIAPIAVVGGAIAVASQIGGFIENAIKPNQLSGSIGGGSNVATGIQTFAFYPKTIRAEFAQIIDNYFDRFGYKINELKTPQFTSRVNWNYIKLTEANIFGNINNDDLKKVNEIFERGITFWHNDNVGNYNRTNPTV